MKKKVKLNPELLNEELKRFRMIENYNFYTGKQELPEYKDLILGTELDEADEEMPDDLTPDDSVGAMEDELGLNNADNADDETISDIPEPEAEPEAELDAELEVAPEPVDDSVEVDVTSIVKGSEEAKQAADDASRNSEILLQKLADLESRIAKMDKVSAKIDGLEQEIIKRNPTPVEKLEMRSLSSYPYTQKLTDYWADKEGVYDVMGNEDKKEYVLKQDDIDSDYSDSNIKKSFTVEPEDEYDEEDI
jgi:hypothetical protein